MCQQGKLENIIHFTMYVSVPLQHNLSIYECNAVCFGMHQALVLRCICVTGKVGVNQKA